VHQVAALRQVNDQDAPDARGRSQIADGLASSDGRVQYFAFQAARKAVSDPRVREQLLRLAASPKAYEAVPALEDLAEPDRFSLDDEVAGAFYRALGHPDPAVVITALDKLGVEAESLAARPGFSERVTGLFAHPNEQVRGRAIELSRRMAAPSERAALAGLLRGRLQDPSPYVRSKAAEALGELGDKTAIPALMKLLDDHASSAVKTEYVDLMGDRVPLEDQGSTWSRVDDAALYALHLLDVFDYGQIDPDRVDQDLAREARRARLAWQHRH
jgi:HEAT repeat protein